MTQRGLNTLGSRSPRRVPISSLTIEAIGGTAKDKGKNIFALGLIARMFDLDVPKLERLISERTRRLATALTQDCETPLKKALTLQEHLRRHYTYTLTPAPVPDQAEPVAAMWQDLLNGWEPSW